MLITSSDYFGIKPTSHSLNKLKKNYSLKNLTEKLVCIVYPWRLATIDFLFPCKNLEFEIKRQLQHHFVKLLLVDNSKDSLSVIQNPKTDKYFMWLLQIQV